MIILFVLPCPSIKPEPPPPLSRLTNPTQHTPTYSTAPITLRDGLVGDVWTSLVRVSLDVAFAALYLLHWLATGVFRWVGFVTCICGIMHTQHTIQPPLKHPHTNETDAT